MLSLLICTVLSILTHYFEVEFESVQICQPGQFFMRLSGYITFLNKILYNKKSSVEFKSSLIDSSYYFK